MSLLIARLTMDLTDYGNADVPELYSNMLDFAKCSATRQNSLPGFPVMNREPEFHEQPGGRRFQLLLGTKLNSLGCSSLGFLPRVFRPRWYVWDKI